MWGKVHYRSYRNMAHKTIAQIGFFIFGNIAHMVGMCSWVVHGRRFSIISVAVQVSAYYAAALFLSLLQQHWANSITK